jgi:FAD/FMN-containing dehydrogenase
MQLVSGTAVARAGNGVSYVYVSAFSSVAPLWAAAAQRGWAAAVEFAPEEVRRTGELWLIHKTTPRQNAFAMMKKVKSMFDPDNVLNPARLYGRI